MGAEEREVSILIPAYGRKEMTLGAVRSSLATGAGEVIVSLDTDPEGFAGSFSEIGDRRLRVVVQTDRLGLWPNHLALLKMASLEYIKFLQTDDRILPGGLRRLCEEMLPGTSIVSGLPYYRDLATGETWWVETGSSFGRWSSSEYLARAEVRGNELGRPSYTLLRRQLVPQDETIWRDDVSADWLVNLTVAARGEVAIIERGTVVCGVHAAQDSAVQSFALGVRRLANTLELLASAEEPRLGRVAAVQAGAALTTIARNALGSVRRGRVTGSTGVLRDIRRVIVLGNRSLLTCRDGRRSLWEAIAVRHVRVRRVPVALPEFPGGASS